MTHIVQIAPSIGPGSGVAGVAYALEREFIAAGATVERFTAADAGGPRRSVGGRTSVATHLTRARNVIWFSTVGTRRARRFLAARPDAVSITHNDVMAGDIYVNHGLLQAAMRARGDYIWRMVRNPVHLFTALRDRIRYRGRTHRAVVALTTTEAELLVSTYGRVRAPIHVIPNGVDIERFRPPDAAERAQARAKLGVDDDRTIALFIGHEFERKGLPIAMAALRAAPDVLLLVVGGSADMIRRAQAQARAAGVAERVHFAGTHARPVPFLWAADVLVLPSAYEANALVVLEALACGLPVVSTRVGFAPDILVDGENGFIVERDAAAVGARLAELDVAAARRMARARPAHGRAVRLAAGGSPVPRPRRVAWAAASGARARDDDRDRCASCTRSDPTGSRASSSSCCGSPSRRPPTATASPSSAAPPTGCGRPSPRPASTHVPAARTLEVTRAVRRLRRRRRRRQHPHDRRRCRHRRGALVHAAGRVDRSSSRRGTSRRPRGRVGPVPIGATRAAPHRRADRDQPTPSPTPSTAPAPSCTRASRTARCATPRCASASCSSPSDSSPRSAPMSASARSRHPGSPTTAGPSRSPAPALNAARSRRSRHELGHRRRPRGSSGTAPTCRWSWIAPAC